MQTNSYRPGDNHHAEDSHVIPMLLRRFDDALRTKGEEKIIWGRGTWMGEFLHVGDTVLPSVRAMEPNDATHKADTRRTLGYFIVSTGRSCTIRELAHTISNLIVFEGRLNIDANKQDGSPMKLMEMSQLVALNWSAGSPRTGERTALCPHVVPCQPGPCTRVPKGGGGLNLGYPGMPLERRVATC